jgi:hypothetical protein
MSPAAPTPLEARQSLTAHAAAKGADLRQKYGSHLGWGELQRILADPDFVRYPCVLEFDAGPLEEGETAYAQPRGERPEDGYRLCIHPYYALDLSRVPLLALYQVAAVNYGAFAGPGDAEAFAAAALGLEVDAYYEALCALADEIGGEPAEPAPGGDGGCGCSHTGGGCSTVG